MVDIYGDVNIKDNEVTSDGNPVVVQEVYTTAVIHDGDVDNKVVFGTDTQDFQTGSSSRMDISDSGVRFGAANARITTVLDEDAMGSDSATALATQQSIKAYVDNTVITDHGALSGLTDDDHTQYLPVNGSRAMTGVLGFGSLVATNGCDITANADYGGAGHESYPIMYLDESVMWFDYWTNNSHTHGIHFNQNNGGTPTIKFAGSTTHDSEVSVVFSAGNSGTGVTDRGYHWLYSTGHSFALYPDNANKMFDVTNSGMQLGGANARVNSILDEDAMGSDSATALATQQSIKAYVDSKKRSLPLFKGLEGAVSTKLFLPIFVTDDMAGRTITEVRIGLTGLPSGQAFKVQVYKNGTASTDSIFTSDTAIEIGTGQSATNGIYMTGCDSSGATVGTPGTTLDSGRVSLAADDVLWMEITQVGTGPAGTDFVGEINVV